MDKVYKICQFFSVCRLDLIKKVIQDLYPEDIIVCARKPATLDKSQIQLINQIIDQLEKNKVNYLSKSYLFFINPSPKTKQRYLLDVS